MSEKTPAVVNFSAQPRSVELREVAPPEIGDEDALIRVKAVSVCGSDLHQWLGQASWKVNYPCILGHEFSGVIEKLGKRATGFCEGDPVVSETAAVIDSQSPMTRRGLYNLDPSRLGFGYGVDGAMTRWVRAPARCLHRLPKNLPFEHAALAEPCAVAYNAVCVNGRVRLGDHVVVLGPGPIGLLCAIMAKLSGAGRLWVAGLAADEKRLAAARGLGAEPVLTEELLDRVREAGDGLGADLVVDAAGVSASLRTALDVVRPAGQIVKVGWGPQPVGHSLDSLVQKAVTLQGSFSHNWPVWERVIQMLGEGQIQVGPLIHQTAPLEDWLECFERMHAGECVKAVLKP